MGLERRSFLPLPAPTESEIALPPPSADEASDLAETGDDISHYSLPDDGTPVTIKTRGHRANKSQTSLLIEYFEGGKSAGDLSGSGSRERRPSVRVRVTPSSKNRGNNDHIQITEMSSRKASHHRSEVDAAEPDDARSLHSYASATEESNVSRNPIEVEIEPGPRRRRKPSSPLIPTSDSKISYVPPNMSDISGIPTDSFLDDSPPVQRKDRTPAAKEARLAGALDTAASIMTDKSSNRGSTRSDVHERSVMQKAVDKASRPDRKQKSRARPSHGSEKDLERLSSPRRKSRSTTKDSILSAPESSVMSSQLTPSHRSFDSYASSKVSINNPKLLETVEDAIRRLILPELDAIKRERSLREGKQPKDRDSFSSLTSASREEISVASKRKSADTANSIRSKTSRGREARNDLSPQSSADEISVTDDVFRDQSTTRNDRAKDGAGIVAAGAAALGAAAALRSPSRGDDRRQRRRKRADPSKRDQHYTDDYGGAEHAVAPPMPLQSEINPSELTRTSILSASVLSDESQRPHSASEEITPVKEVARGVAAVESTGDAPGSEKTAAQSAHAMRTLHENISHGDLKNLPRRGTMDQDELDDEELRRESARRQDDYYDDYDEDARLDEPGMYDEDEERLQQAFYGHQDVPAPLRYVPYQQERRGLSPIQSVSGWTEGEGSEYQSRRDSRLGAPTSSDLSSPEKDHRVWSPTSIPSNMRSREFNDEASSVLSSGVGYNNRQSVYTEDSELDNPGGGRTVQHVGGNPQMIHRDSGPESAVASLVDGSMLDPSLLSGSGVHGHEFRNSHLSYNEGPIRSRSAQGSPLKQSAEVEQEMRPRSVSPVSTAGGEHSTVSQDFVEYDLDEYGRKVPRPQYRQSPTASESAITSAALRQAAAEAMKRKNISQVSLDEEEEEFVGEGVSRNKSFKERARGNFNLAATPKHSTDRLSDFSEPRMTATGLPDMGDPMPEIGYGYSDGGHSRQQTPSIVEGHPGDRYADDREGAWTPTQEATHYQYDRASTPKASESRPSFFGATDAAAAATIATATALAAAHHNREPSQDQDEEWQRTSGDRKRDTLVTNPYEGSSPIANLPGLDGLQGGYGANAYPNFNTGSPGLPAGDEGYISSAPNEMRDSNAKGKGVDFGDQSRAGPSEDPFYSAPKPQRELSRMNQGAGSPLYDASTGTGIDRIQSTDIIALMEHLMVRDAQRSARDTEMLVTLVRSAAEMRNSFEDIKRMLADTEDQIITEIKDNTEETVKRHLGGPRPFPGSGARSLQGGSQAGTMDEVAKKKRSFLRRALQGLGNKGASDLGRIEDMLMQLLTDVDVLKHQTAGPEGSPGAQSMRSVENPELDAQYEDRGYEPEGHAGTSTGSYASHSGALSIGKGSTRNMHDRKVSDNRISTVPEGDEDDFEDTFVSGAGPYSPEQPGFLSPAPQQRRGGSVPLGTPPQSSHQMMNSQSNENTPRTDDGKKHKSRGSATFFPKISRWSETTTSSLGKVFRTSGTNKKNLGEPPEDFLQHPASRSGSVDDYDGQYQYDSYGQDKLHSGFSEHDLSANVGGPAPTPSFNNNGGPPVSYATPEDPKYKAHRNSLNLQHPQPRAGQTERFRTALESSAQIYDTSGPMSPQSTNWAGSATSLNRFPEQNTNRYSDNSALTGQTGESYRWQQSPAPPRPPKEPLEGSPLAQVHSPPQNSRLSQVARTSPMPYASAVDSGYGTGSATHAGSWHSGSPRPENKNLSSALGVPTRRPSGPRAMTPTRSLDESDSERRRKRGE